MKGIMKKAVFLAAAGMTALALSGCSAGSGGKRIVRISHAQSETHPEHLGLLAFKEYVEERLGEDTGVPEPLRQDRSTGNEYIDRKDIRIYENKNRVEVNGIGVKFTRKE